jgi:hypothetical protein
MNIRLEPLRGRQPEVGVGIVSALVGALTLATPSHAKDHPSITGSCPTATAMDFRVTHVHKRFKGPIAETLVDFVQGGAGPGCVVVMFSSPLIYAGGQTPILAAVLDDDSSSPGFFSKPIGTGNMLEPFTFVYIFPGVSPGPHHVQMEILPENIGVGMGDLMTLVYHTP